MEAQGRPPQGDDVQAEAEGSVGVRPARLWGRSGSRRGKSTSSRREDEGSGLSETREEAGVAGVQRAEKEGGVEPKRDEATSDQALLASASIWLSPPHTTALPLPEGWAFLLGEVGIRCHTAWTLARWGQGRLDGSLWGKGCGSLPTDLENLHIRQVMLKILFLLLRRC